MKLHNTKKKETLFLHTFIENIINTRELYTQLLVKQKC